MESAGERNFLKSLEGTFREAKEHGDYSASDFVTICSNIIGFLKDCKTMSINETRRRWLISLPDGSEPQTKLQPPPVHFELNKSTKKKLLKTKSTDECIQVLAKALKAKEPKLPYPMPQPRNGKKKRKGRVREDSDSDYEQSNAPSAKRTKISRDKSKIAETKKRTTLILHNKQNPNSRSSKWDDSGGDGPVPKSSQVTHLQNLMSNPNTSGFDDMSESSSTTKPRMLGTKEGTEDTKDMKHVEKDISRLIVEFEARNCSDDSPQDPTVGIGTDTEINEHALQNHAPNRQPIAMALNSIEKPTASLSDIAIQASSVTSETWDAFRPKLISALHHYSSSNERPRISLDPAIEGSPPHGLATALFYLGDELSVFSVLD